MGHWRLVTFNCYTVIGNSACTFCLINLQVDKVYDQLCTVTVSKVTFLSLPRAHVFCAICLVLFFVALQNSKDFINNFLFSLPYFLF